MNLLHHPRPCLDRLPVMMLGMVLLAGCAVGQNYQKPELPVAPHYDMQAVLDQHGGAGAAPLETFWQGFNDPVLSALMGHALTDNLDLAIATTRVEQSRALAQQVGTLLLPAVEASVSALREQQSLQDPVARIARNFPGYSRGQSDDQIGVGASWEADMFGGNRRRLEAASASYEASIADFAATRTLIVAEVANAYFQLRGAEHRVSVINEEIKVDGDLLDLVNLRLDQGLSTVREKAEAEGLLYQAEAALSPLQEARALAANRLDVLMGKAPGASARSIAVSDVEVMVPALASSIGPAELLQRRPDVIQAERRLAAANANLGVATAEYYPRLSLSALLGTEAYQAGDLFSAATFQPQLLLGVRWRLFDFGRIDAEVAQATGARAEALLSYRRSMINATADVENAMVRLLQSEARQDALGHEADADERARSAAEDAYKGGAVGLFEVLEEERELIAARDQLEAARTDRAIAAVAAYKALGGGW